MMIQYFYHNVSCTYYLPLIPFSNIINISLFVNSSNFTSVFFKQAYHANPGIDKKWAGSSSYI